MKLKKSQVIVSCLLVFLPIASECVMFDFYLVDDEKRNRSDNEKRCLDLGYDGLAVVNSPEAYSYALNISEHLRTATGLGVFLGLEYNSNTGEPMWDDGSEIASDIPWIDDLNSGPDYPYGRIKASGLFALGEGDGLKYSLCGFHKNLPRETRGYTTSGQQPRDVTSILFKQSVPSYLSCVMLCGQDNRCRAAEFNVISSTCQILGPGTFSGLEYKPEFQTFIRITYT